MSHKHHKLTRKHVRCKSGKEKCEVRNTKIFFTPKQLTLFSRTQYFPKLTNISNIFQLTWLEGHWLAAPLMHFSSS